MKNYLLLISIFLYSCSTPTPKKCPDFVYEENITRLNGELYSGRCATYQNDTLRSIQQYINGKDHGKWTFFFSNGEIETSGKFSNGQRVGKWKYYYSNGNIKQISRYRDGEKYGNWLNYDENGKLILKVKHN